MPISVVISSATPSASASSTSAAARSQPTRCSGVVSRYCCQAAAAWASFCSSASSVSGSKVLRVSPVAGLIVAIAMSVSSPVLLHPCPCPRSGGRNRASPHAGVPARGCRGPPSVPRVDLFRTKSVEHIEEDARGDGSDGGVGHLRRHLSARHLVGFGIGVVIGTGIFTLTGVEARNTARALGRLLLRDRRRRRPARRALLRRARLQRPDGGQRVLLRLRHHGRADRLDHRLGPVPGVRAGCGGRRPRLVGLRGQPAAPADGVLRGDVDVQPRCRADRRRPHGRGGRSVSASPRG